MTSVKDIYDLVILGSGSTAFAAAIRTKELGKTAVMTEVRTLGGTCVNRGCLPSKNLIEAARLVYDAAHPRYPGLTPAHLGVDFPALVAQKDEIIHEYRDQHYASIVDETDEQNPNPIQVVPGRAVLIDPHTVEVTTSDGSLRRLTGNQLLIATGSAPLIPDIPGLANTPYPDRRAEARKSGADAESAGRFSSRSSANPIARSSRITRPIHSLRSAGVETKSQ